jgi:hypothetical protein
MWVAIALAMAMSSTTTAPVPMGLERIDIDNVLGAALPELQACRRSGAAGAVVFDLLVNDAGVVSDVVRVATGSSSRGLDDVAACARPQLAWLRFAAPAGTDRIAVRARIDVGVDEMTVRTTTLATSHGELVRQHLPIEIERTSRTLRRPLRACHARTGARIGVAFTLDDAGRATDVDVTDATGTAGAVDGSCVRSVVEATPWPHVGAARISTVLLDERNEPTSDAVFAEQMRRLTTCYGEALTRNSRLVGTLTLRIVIAGDGVVVEVDALDPAPGVVALVEPSMVACAVGAVRQSVFPPSTGGLTTVTYSAVFRR